jgi:type I restriction-modification system DNA methylase subunit
VKHFHHGMFHGYDFDNTMLRIGSMNMALHGVDNPDIRYKDSLAQDHSGEEEKYSLILANPPFAGRWTTRTRPRTCWPSSRPRRPSCCSWRCSCGC